MNNNQKFINNWKNIKKKGILRYIIFQGILPFIIGAFLGLILGIAVFEKESIIIFMYKNTNFIGAILIYIIIFAITGAASAIYHWNKNDEKYDRINKSN